MSAGIASSPTRTLGLAVPARIRPSYCRGVCVSLPGVRRERLGSAHLEFPVPFSQRRFLAPHGRRRRRRSSPSFTSLARHYARSRSRPQRSDPPSRQHGHRYLLTGHRYGRAPLRSSHRLRTSAGPSARDPGLAMRAVAVGAAIHTGVFLLAANPSLIPSP